MLATRLVFACALLGACNPDVIGSAQEEAAGGAIAAGADPRGGGPGAAASGGAAAASGGAAAASGGGGGQPTGASSGGAFTDSAGAGARFSAGAGGGGNTSSASSGTGGTSGNGGAAPTAAGPVALAALESYLALQPSARPLLESEPFASVPLDEAQAETARRLLWDDHAAFIRQNRKADADRKAVTIGDKTLRYDFKVFGAKPTAGRSLFVSLHGGGEAAASVNDEQWENQKALYQPDEGVYLAPRAPTNTWNLWHEAHIDALLQRLIEDMIVFQEVDSNRVYIMGYSAGGDGVYQLGPRMADRWAAAAMMAGHPNDAEPDSLRNIGFAIHVGALDTAFDRHLVAEEWGSALDELRSRDMNGYAHVVRVHANKPHWMDLEDAVAVPWMAGFTRNPVPRRIVWLQDDVVHERFYWLAVPREQAKKGSRLVAAIQGQALEIVGEGVSRCKVRLSDALLDLDESLTIDGPRGRLFSGSVPRTIRTLATTLKERGDRAQMFSAEVDVPLDQ